MFDRIKAWFLQLLRALFPEDMLDQIRQAAGAVDDGAAESGTRGEALTDPGSSAGQPTQEELDRMKETPVERRHIVFFGRVQGVGFRYHAMYDARNQGLTGWVENRYDGSVEMEIQGPGGAIDYVLENLGNGRWIRIDAMESRKIPVVREERGFQVR